LPVTLDEVALNFNKNDQEVDDDLTDTHHLYDSDESHSMSDLRRSIPYRKEEGYEESPRKSHSFFSRPF